MEASQPPPFRDLLGLVALGRYALPAFPFPWSCWGVALDGDAFGWGPRVVPGLLLQPMVRWTLDTDLLLAWANGEDGVPQGPELLQALVHAVPPGWARMPGPFELRAAVGAVAAIERRCVALVASGPAGCREVARSHPWTFLGDTVLEPAERQLGLTPGADWPACAERVLEAAGRVAAPEGRPRRAPDLDRSLALREEVAWLRARADRRGAFGVAIEALIAGEEDREAWPIHGAAGAADGQRFRALLNVVHQRLREHGAVPVVVPLMDQAWSRSSERGWVDAPDGGPEIEALNARVADPRLGGVVRVVAGGSFEHFSFADEGVRGWMAWAGEVPVAPG